MTLTLDTDTAQTPSPCDLRSSVLAPDRNSHDVPPGFISVKAWRRFYASRASPQPRGFDFSWVSNVVLFLPVNFFSNLFYLILFLFNVPKFLPMNLFSTCPHPRSGSGQGPSYTPAKASHLLGSRRSEPQLRRLPRRPPASRPSMPNNQHSRLLVGRLLLGSWSPRGPVFGAGIAWGFILPLRRSWINEWRRRRHENGPPFPLAGAALRTDFPSAADQTKAAGRTLWQMLTFHWLLPSPCTAPRSNPSLINLHLRVCFWETQPRQNSFPTILVLF